MSQAGVLKQLQQAHERFVSGRVEEAIAMARRAIAKAPGHAEGSRLLAQLLLTQGRTDEARYALEQAIKADPLRADLLVQLAETEAMGGNAHAALDAAEQALQLDPADSRGLAVRGRVLLGLNRFTESVADLQRASAALPDEPEHRSNLAMALLNSGHATEACNLLRELVAQQPEFLPAHAALAMALNYHPEAAIDEIFAAHQSYGRLCEAAITPMQHDAALLCADGPIRVGFLTRDLRRHSCAYFLRPILEQLDRTRFEPVAYMDDPHADDLTELFRGRFAVWRETSKLSNADLAKVISGDGVGVLLDLGGHFFGNRLGVMAHRPAPASATYLAYPNTTGLSRIDARLVDSLTDPAPAAEALATESVIRLDGGEPSASLWCFRPDHGLPEPAALPPHGEDHPFTFVSFNDLKKINDPLLDDWAAILQRVPKAQLLLKAGALGDEAVRGELRERFVSRGVAGDRVELLGHLPDHAEHLRLYQRAHVALDTHPYCGTTTTLEAAWMGVPTVTLVPHEGTEPIPRHASRVGLSLNTALGLQEFVTTSRAAYVERAVELAEAFVADDAALNASRLGLRARFVASSLRDETGFVRRFESGLSEVIEMVRSQG